MVKAGEAVVAGSESHLTLARVGESAQVFLKHEKSDTPYQPSVNVLFESVAEHFGARAVGVLLTGMGSDGAEGLLKMQQSGAHTIAQDKESCLVYGMPGAAVELDAAEQIVSLKHIPTTIVNLLRVDPKD